MANVKETILDQGKTLSQSRLWELQHAIYQHFGPSVWSVAGVPSYVTSNPFTASQYAKIAFGFIRDGLSGKSDVLVDRNFPLYIIDMGAGTGRFGYLFLKELTQLLEILQINQLKICYVMTDMIAENLDYLKKHPYLQANIQAGTIDFAYYHTSFIDQPLYLQISKQQLIAGQMINPLIIIGNYFFDVIPQDLFKTIDNVLHEGVISLYCKGEIDAQNPHPADLKNLYARYHYRPIDSENYYADPKQNALLKEYAASLVNVPFTLPVGAFQAINYFKSLASDRLLLLAGDQGACNEVQIKESGEPEISLQGGISLAVSYDAIAKYFQYNGGCAWQTTMPDPLFVVIVAAFKGTLQNFPETSLAFHTSLDWFQPSDYWTLTGHLESLPLEHILLSIKLGYGDPLNFYAYFTTILSHLPSASKKNQALLAETIRHVWQQFYPVSRQEGEFIMNLGVLFFKMGLFTEALFFFEQALQWGEENTLLLQNLAACHGILNQKKEALYFQLKIQNRLSK